MRHFGPRHLFDRASLDVKNMTMQKQQRAQGSILRRCADASAGRQPRQEGRALGAPIADGCFL
jgi:hypothetical protein